MTIESGGNVIIPVTGAGTRMMWYPGKAAFRAGYVNHTQWDNVNIGSYSTAIGYKTTASGMSVGAQLAPGANSWTTISDVNLKENFKPIDGEEVLDKIADFKPTTWNYKIQEPGKFRHYGPMAQDFYAAFGNDGIGTIGDDTSIAQRLTLWA